MVARAAEQGGAQGGARSGGSGGAQGATGVAAAASLAQPTAGSPLGKRAIPVLRALHRLRHRALKCLNNMVQHLGALPKQKACSPPLPFSTRTRRLPPSLSHSVSTRPPFDPCLDYVCCDWSASRLCGMCSGLSWARRRRALVPGTSV